MEHNKNDESSEPKRPEGPQGRPPARSDGAEGPISEDIAPADAGAENQECSTPNPLIPAFTPVPRLKDRSNGWKPHIQQAFIEALAETGSVAAACRRVGRSDMGAYALRRHPEGATFRAAWDAALDLGVRRIEDGAMDRALYGTEETIHYHGEHVATRRRYNERLVMFILRNRAPQRFAEGGARGLSAMDRTRMNQLKKQWRREWEEERRREDDEHDDGDLLTGELEVMHRNWFTTLSPATRAAYALFRRRARADKDNGYSWMDQPGRDPAADGKVIDAQYEEHFGDGNDERRGIWKVVDVEGVGEADVAGEPAPTCPACGRDLE